MLLSIWAVVGAAMLLIGLGGRLRTAGMPLAYFLGLSLIHTPGAAVYLSFPNWDVLADRTLVGFQETVIGMVAFLIGVMVARHIRFSPGANRPLSISPAIDAERLNKLSLVYLGLGVCYFGAGSLVTIPSVGAAVASLISLLIVGICLRLWVAAQQGNRVKFWLTVSLLPLLPLITIVRDGFIGFGTYWMLSAASFAITQSRRRLIYFLLAPFIAYFGLSVFVNYMASRTAFRQAVWYQQVGITDRIERVVNMFRNFELLDAQSAKQREVIDGRLNQNLLVGTAVERLRSGQVAYANGSTIVQIAAALIPRAIWPNKPQVGGGGSVVREYTGKYFLEGTAVGNGQVLEFYVNFATWGVIGGFLLYGWMIGWMDLRIMKCLEQNDQRGFLLWSMVCLALLQPGGNLLEVVVTAASSAVTATALGFALKGLMAPARQSTKFRTT
jgi:hypothetical protein